MFWSNCALCRIKLQTLLDHSAVTLKHNHTLFTSLFLMKQKYSHFESQSWWSFSASGGWTLMRQFGQPVPWHVSFMAWLDPDLMRYCSTWEHIIFSHLTLSGVWTIHFGSFSALLKLKETPHRIKYHFTRMFKSNCSRQLQRKPFWLCPLLCSPFQSYSLYIGPEVLLYCIECVLNFRFVRGKQTKGQSQVSIHGPLCYSSDPDRKSVV